MLLVGADLPKCRTLRVHFLYGERDARAPRGHRAPRARATRLVEGDGDGGGGGGAVVVGYG